jgi:hypothetical protein
MDKMIWENDRRFIRFLSDALLVFACCLFLISVVEPFLTSKLFLPRWYETPVETRVSVNYWSYKVTISVGHEELFFNDYWFFGQNIYASAVLMDPIFLITMFLTQVFTLFLGSLCLFSTKGRLRTIPFVSSAIVTMLMVRTYVLTHASVFASVNYGLGYWLTYPSITLFLLAFTLSAIAKKKQTTNAVDIRAKIRGFCSSERIEKKRAGRT